MSLRRRMQSLVAATVLPVATMLVYDAYTSWSTQHQTAERTAIDQARLLAGSFSATLEGARQVAKAIVAHVEHEPGGVATCSDFLATIVRAEPAYFGAAVMRPDGTEWCRSTAEPAPRVTLADRPYFQAALRSTELVVGEVVQGRVVNRPSLPLALSYRDSNGQVLGVVILPLNLLELATSVAEQFPLDRGFALILDREGKVAVGVPDHAGTVAQRVPPEALTALPTVGAQVIDRLDYRGRDYIVGLAALAGPSAGPLVMVGLDREMALAPARATLLRSLAVAALAIAIAIFAGWWVGHRLIETPIRRFVDAAQRQAAGELQARFPEARPGTEFGRLGGALNVMVAELERLIDQKTLLIREVQHRVMNSLQLLSAFLHLQSRQVSDAAVRKHLMDARERILSLSVIYRHLYHSEATSTVEFGETLRALCAEMARTYTTEGADGIVVRAQTVPMPMETALSLALIVHEMVTNAMKHAYDSAGGPLVVELAREGDQFRLAVSDNGKGLPPDFALERRGSLGMTVIRTLAAQLHGTVTAERVEPAGTRFAVTFPANEVLAAA